MLSANDDSVERWLAKSRLQVFSEQKHSTGRVSVRCMSELCSFRSHRMRWLLFADYLRARQGLPHRFAPHLVSPPGSRPRAGAPRCPPSATARLAPRARSSLVVLCLHCHPCCRWAALSWSRRSPVAAAMHAPHCHAGAAVQMRQAACHYQTCRVTTPPQQRHCALVRPQDLGPVAQAAQARRPRGCCAASLLLVGCCGHAAVVAR
jgi:hypothetical protein